MLRDVAISSKRGSSSFELHLFNLSVNAWVEVEKALGGQGDAQHPLTLPRAGVP